MDNYYESNRAVISGVISSKFEYYNEVNNEEFYKVYIDVKRLSGKIDKLPVIVSESLIDARTDYTGCFVEINGQFRSYNLHENDKNKLLLYVFCTEWTFVSKNRNNNNVILDGYICKTPVNRTTPFGRNITDIILAVNRSYGKSDYIPCVTWGRTAMKIMSKPVGTRLNVSGRLQSRDYVKKIGDKSENRTAYEVSVESLYEISDEEGK